MPLSVAWLLSPLCHWRAVRGPREELIKLSDEVFVAFAFPDLLVLVLVLNMVQIPSLKFFLLLVSRTTCLQVFLLLIFLSILGVGGRVE